MGRFCSRCGVEEPAVIVDGLCVRCLVEEGRAVRPPKNVKVVVCPSCGSIKLEGKWLDGIALEEFLKELMWRESKFHREFKPNSLSISIEGSKIIARFEGLIKTSEVIKEFLIDLTMSKSLCPHCSKVKSGYYEAIIQVRTYSETLNESLRGKLVNTLLKYANTSKNISEIEFVRKGLDVKVLSVSVARKIANDLISMYGGTSVESWKAVGISADGRKASKLTISLRLLGLTCGDLIMFKGIPALVEEVSQGSARVRALDSGNLIRLHAHDLSSGDVVILDRGEYELVEGYVVSVSDDKAVVRDVRRGRIFELPAYEGLLSGLKVRLLIYKDRIYLARVEK